MQHGFTASPDEEAFGCSEQKQKILYRFTSTGFGDFAVLVCSDALPERIAEYCRELRGKLDILIVIARNKGMDLPNGLCDRVREDGWVIVYANGLDRTSQVITPMHKQRPIEDSECGAVIDIRNLNELMIVEPDQFHRPTRKGFHPAPRHWPDTRRRAIGFRRYSKVLAVGSHFDDIWLGCSATLMKLVEVYCAQVFLTSLCHEYPHLYFGMYNLSNRKQDMHDLMISFSEALGFQWYKPNQDPQTLQDRNFKNQRADLEKAMESLANVFADAELVFIPRQDDAHDDHVVTAKLALSMFRSATLLEYEVKEFRRRPFRPSIAVDVGQLSNTELKVDAMRFLNSGKSSFAEKKAGLLSEGFRRFFGGDVPKMFNKDYILGKMRLRAAEIRSEVQYAEAFASDIMI